MEELAEFSLNILYITGHLSSAADALSRLKGGIPIPEIGDQYLSPAGLVINGQPTAGGGDSLFVSLVRVLKSVPGVNIADNPEHLCQRLVDELLAHHQENKVTLDGILHKELKLMCHRGQHPSLDLLLVASRIFQVRICVSFWSKQAVIDQFENYDRVVHLQCVSGIHVNPLSELRNYVPPNSNDCNIIDVETTVSKNPLMHDDDVSEVEEEVLQNLLVINETKCCDHKLSSQPSVFIAVNDHDFCAVLDTGA
jgi:hypothetical protein